MRLLRNKKYKSTTKQDAEFDLGALLSNPLVLGLLMSIPGHY